MSERVPAWFRQQAVPSTPGFCSVVAIAALALVAVAKINLFAYRRATGTPVWQSGAEHVASHSRERWFFGAGPFQDGRSGKTSPR